jgi:hypothetical protein
MVSRSALGPVSRGRRGGGALGCLVPLLIISIIGYFAVHASDAAFKYYRLRDAMQQEARFAHRRTDDQIRVRLRAFVDSMEIPIPARRISVRRTETAITIESAYSQTIDFPFFSKRVDFHPRVERRF